MLQELLTRIEQQAEHSNPTVRAAALLRIARVRSAIDRKKARSIFQLALEEIQSSPGRDREFFLQEARLIAAAVAPDLIGEVRVVRHSMRPFWEEKIGRIMLEHGNVDAAFDYVMNCDGHEDFPYSAVSMLLPKLRDEEQRSAVLRRAIDVGRIAPSLHFIMFFSTHWEMLHSEEARDAVRDIVRVTMEQPDRPITATYDPERTIEITSTREHTFFQLLHILRRVDNTLAESLIDRNQQLAEAARHFPNGTESLREAAEKRRKEIPTGESCGSGYAMVGDPRDFPYLRALMEGTSGDFDPSLSYAIDKYQADTAPENPNQAPKYFWPSTCAFRQILYAAGKRIGEGATVYLDGIADHDVRLFAEIELLAALAGLPEFQSVQREYRPARSASTRVTLDRGDIMPNIRCPKCSWKPRERGLWMCRCGHVWNTFHTRGVCPSCRYKWEETGCLQCGAMSPHSEWYTTE